MDAHLNHIMLNVSGLFNCHHLPPSSSSYCTQEGDEFSRVCKSERLCDMKENKERRDVMNGLMC